MLSWFIAVSFAVDPVLGLAGPVRAGLPTLAVMDGLEPGERVYILRGTTEASSPVCPPNWGGGCTDIADPSLVAKGRANDRGFAIFTIDVPAEIDPSRLVLQGVTQRTRSAVLDRVDEVDYPVVLHPTFEDAEGMPTLGMTGFDITCDAGEVSALVEYKGAPDVIGVSGYLGGSAVVSFALTPLEPAPGAIFLYAEGAAPLASCAGLTWLIVLNNADEVDCVADGPDEALFTAATGGVCRQW